MCHCSKSGTSVQQAEVKVRLALPGRAPQKTATESGGFFAGFLGVAFSGRERLPRVVFSLAFAPLAAAFLATILWAAVGCGGAFFTSHCHATAAAAAAAGQCFGIRSCLTYNTRAAPYGAQPSATIPKPGHVLASSSTAPALRFVPGSRHRIESPSTPNLII